LASGVCDAKGFQDGDKEVLRRMGADVILTPTGRLAWSAAGAEASPACGAHGAAADLPTWHRGLVEALADSSAAGLFALAADGAAAGATPAMRYWGEFAGRFLTALCHLPDAPDAPAGTPPPPSPAEMAELLLSVPPMTGAEYLREEVLAALWEELGQWLAARAVQAGGAAAFLAERAPRWHQVGRVCFHLAENKADEQRPFAFLATYSVGISQAGRVQHLPLQRALQQYAGANNRPALQKLLEPVHRATTASRFAAELVESGEIYQPVTWTPDRAYRFLCDVPVLEDSGLVVRLPDWWKKRARPRVSVTIGQKRESRLGAGAMLSFDVRAALGDQDLTAEEWQAMMNAPDGLVRLRGQWVEVDRQRLSEAMEHWQAVQRAAKNGEISFIEGMRLLAGAPADLTDAGAVDTDREWSFLQAGRQLAEVLDALRRPGEAPVADAGADLKATLRPYQREGVSWLRLLTGLGLGACLADDMGLGKTIQVLALLLCLKRLSAAAEGDGPPPSLLIVPASLLGNWKAEADRFAPALTLRFLHASQADVQELQQAAAGPDALAGADLVVTTYGMAARLEWLAQRPWRLVILDEAQAIKNPATRQTRAVKKLHGDARIVLTGTPVENRLGDLWSLLDFLNPGLLGSAADFRTFVKAMEARESDRYAPLRRLVGPYLLRRLKTDKAIIADLPDKTEMKAFCGLSKRQIALYESSVRELETALEASDGIQRKGLILAYLMRFKQICNHPSQFLGDGLYAPADSGKFDRLRQIAEEIASRQEKAIVFTQFREMTDPLAEFLAGIFLRGGLVLHGGTPVKARKGMVDEFQSDTGPPFFVLSLKAGGTGLNLTAASHVIHFDRWWNPAVENQATDRAFRIGQRRNVLVHKFVTQGTVEERIDEMIRDKTELAGALLEGSAERKLTELTNEELLRMVSLDIHRAET
jgi:non-specific serine/threonine protein kinase